MPIEVRSATATERGWVAEVIALRYAGDFIVARGVVHPVADLNAMIAWEGDERIGLLTWEVKGAELEVVTLFSIHERRGAGSALMQAAIAAAREYDCSRLWLVTTNDNTPALRFYQRVGLRVVAVHRGGMDRDRATKPAIPLLGVDDIPMHDYIELEFALS